MSLEDDIVSATSQKNTSEDWGLIISICERIDYESTAHEAIGFMVRRIAHPNVNVVLYTLVLANAIVQNCGLPAKREIASRVFLEALMRVIVNKSTHETVRSRCLDFIQQWSDLFKDEPSLGFMVDTYNNLIRQGYNFPPRHQPEKTPKRSDVDKEEEEFQLALALSLSDAEKAKPVEKRAPSPVRTRIHKPLFKVKALYDFAGQDEGELRLVRGDVIDVHDATTFKDWWKGESRGQVGIFPANYVEKITDGATPQTSVPPLATSSDAGLMREAEKVQQFMQILSTMDPRRSSLSENDKLQELYSGILALRPKVLQQLETTRTKQKDLSDLRERLTRAFATYTKLMEAHNTAIAAQPVYAAPTTAYGYPYGGQGYAYPYTQPPGSAPGQAYTSQSGPQGYTAPYSQPPQGYDPNAAGYAQGQGGGVAGAQAGYGYAPPGSGGYPPSQYGSEYNYPRQ